MNQEIEAHYAQYLYVSSLPEYKGSKWEEKYEEEGRYKYIARLEKHIDSKGIKLKKSETEKLELYILNSLIPKFHKDGYAEKNFPYDYHRTSLDNFKNIRKLTQNCNP